MIPQQTYTTTASLITNPFSDDVLNEEDMLRQLSDSNSLTLNVVAIDTYTGERTELEGVSLRSVPGTPFSGIGPDSNFRLYSPTYEAFKRKRVDLMYVTKIESKPKLINKALPEQVKLKDTADSFFGSNTNTCVKFNISRDNLKKFKGYVYDREDITDYSGKGEQTGGMVVHNEDGTLYLYDKSGKNYVLLDGSNIEAKSMEIEIGMAAQGRTSGPGIYTHENKVNDTVPQGTILCPSMKVIPNFLKIANTVLVMYDLCDFVITLGACVSEVVNNQKRG